MKKFFKWFFIILAVIILLLTIIGFLAHESRPATNPSPEADALAQQMMESVDKTAWDTTTIISWDFAGRQQYIWDKSRHFVKVMWGKNTVLLHTKTVTGKAYKEGKALQEKDATELISQAWKHFCNDSFWLNAVVKAFDEGTTRSLIKTEDGDDALMVSYETGGVTPGDAYGWILDETGQPKSWKMWVGMIPIGGIEFTWESWITLDTGAKVATLHKSRFFDLKINDVKGSVSWEAHGLSEDPFTALEN